MTEDGYQAIHPVSGDTACDGVVWARLIACVIGGTERPGMPTKPAGSTLDLRLLSPAQFAACPRRISLQKEEMRW
jgi:hypothetical protein